MEPEIAIILVSLLFSAFFSGMEIAFVSSNKIHIELEKKQEGFLAKVLSWLTEHPSRFIATMLIGNNLALVVYGIYMGGLLMDLTEAYASELPDWTSLFFKQGRLLTHTVISTVVILLTAEFLPKVMFRIYANSLLKGLALPAYLFYLLFGPFSWLVIRFSDFVLRTFFKTEGDEVQLSFSKLELGDYITERMESVEEREEVDSEIQIFQNALEFAEVKAREVMVPRTELVAVELREDIGSLAQMFTETGYSKILVYKDTIDEIVGYVHSFALFRKPRTIRNVLMPVEFVPETMLIQNILDILTKKRKSVAVVLDEYGGTSGIMTVEDIVEELFGEIEDEHDVVELLEERLDTHRYRFSARLEVDYLNEQYRLELPEGDEYETLGGLIMSEIEEIPERDSEVRIDRFLFHIEEVSNTKIDVVGVEIVDGD